ncbi:MAG: hypothetical protein RLZZ387_885 [Chloroflexota bacterium]
MGSDRTLVTGATGFLGQNLVRALRDQGREVRALVRRPAGDPAARELAEAGVEVVHGDVLDADALRAALRDVTTVFHLAGRLLVAGVPDSAYEELHVGGTRALLLACAEAGTMRAIVHCSTTGVLGPTGPRPADEDAPMRPGNIYERTKADGERLALELGCAHGLPVSVARPALVYGPGDMHLLGWFRVIRRGLYRVIGDGASLLHPVYIDDLVAGLLRCAECPTAVGRVYHLVGDGAVPVRDLAASIAAAQGTRLPRQHLPLPVAHGVAALLEALPGVPPSRLPLTRGRVRFMTESRAYSGERAQRELGFSPRTDLAAGLGQTVRWYERAGVL